VKKFLSIFIPIFVVVCVLLVIPGSMLFSQIRNERIGIVMDKAFLRQVSVPVENFDEELAELVDTMRTTLGKANGIGLAAPQIGVLVRVILVKNDGEIIEAINPEIIEMQNPKNSFEGCLSLPWRVRVVRRYSQITMRAQDRTGEFFQVSLSGTAAFCASHEIDHLDGILMIDRAAGKHETVGQNATKNYLFKMTFATAS
jgi:peptide deformylase